MFYKGSIKCCVFAGYDAFDENQGYCIRWNRCFLSRYDWSKFIVFQSVLFMNKENFGCPFDIYMAVSDNSNGA